MQVWWQLLTNAGAKKKPTEYEEGDWQDIGMQTLDPDYTTPALELPLNLKHKVCVLWKSTKARGRSRKKLKCKTRVTPPYDGAQVELKVADIIGANPKFKPPKKTDIEQTPSASLGQGDQGTLPFSASSDPGTVLSYALPIKPSLSPRPWTPKLRPLASMPISLRWTVPGPRLHNRLYNLAAHSKLSTAESYGNHVEYFIPGLFALASLMVALICRQKFRSFFKPRFHKNESAICDFFNNVDRQLYASDPLPT